MIFILIGYVQVNESVMLMWMSWMHVCVCVCMHVYDKKGWVR